MFCIFCINCPHKQFIEHYTQTTPAVSSGCFPKLLAFGADSGRFRGIAVMPTMAASMDSGKWVFTKEQLQNTPSRRCNIDYDKEIYYRQQAATLIQEMGQRLQV